MKRSIQSLRIEIAPNVYYFSTSPKAKTNSDFADGFQGKPFAGTLVKERVLIDPLRSDETHEVIKPTDRLAAYWRGQRLRARFDKGELVIRECDHLLVPSIPENTPCTCLSLPPAQPDARLPLNYV